MTERIEFIDCRRETMFTPIPDGYKFKPRGRGRWFQTQAWRFLQWCGALESAYQPTVKITRVSIGHNGRDFMAALYEQRASLFEQFGRKGTRLLIGAQDFEELMCSPPINVHVRFIGDYHRNRQIMGLTVEVLPWMRGMVVMP
jgi:hypothetical protein